MSVRPKLLAFAGSTRQDSLNKKLLAIAVAGARAAGADVTIADLRDFPMPLYDGDLEKAHGLPPEAKRWKSLLVAHHGLLVASPEYNSSISGVLKNAIDWASRPEPNEKPLVAFQGKVAALLAASPSLLGGVRGLVAVRTLLGNIGVIVLPDQVTLPKANEAFDASGALTDEKTRAKAEGLGKTLAAVTAKLLVG